MHYLVVGLAKTGTTALFTSLKQALPTSTETFFEPHTKEEFIGILKRNNETLTKALIGHVTSEHNFIRHFYPHILIIRDPRDQIVSELMYRFYDFKLRGDVVHYEKAYAILERKVQNSSSISTIDCFNQISSLVDKPGMEKLVVKIRCLLDYRNTFQPYILNYESFIDGEVQELEKYLGFKIPILPDVDSEFKRVIRTKSYGEWRAWFTNKDIEFVNKNIGELIKDMGYEIENESILLNTLPISTTLDYIKQFKP